MFEPLKVAIEKARQQRDGLDSPAAAGATAPASRRPVPSHDKVQRARPVTRKSAVADAGEEHDNWMALTEIRLNDDALLDHRIITRQKSNPAYIAFDQLRTRMTKVLRDNNWRSVAITSPTRGCGKSFVSLNLAMTFCRQPNLKTVLIDMDLKAPSLASTLGYRDIKSLGFYLAGHMSAEDYFMRVGNNLALGLNTERVRDSSELIQNESSFEAIEKMTSLLEPDTVIFDLPPMLETDDVIAFLPQVDCVLLVAAAGETLPGHIDECERLFSGQTNFLGVLLNKTEQILDAGYYSEHYGD